MAQQYEPLIDDKFTIKRNIQVNSDWNATSGKAQILNKPAIPAEQVNSDWNATSGKAQILNKPDLSTYAQGVSLGNILFVSASAPTINDSQTRTDALGRIDRPFKSIQSALNVSTNQDTIFIFEGVYNGDITLNCNLVCIGNVVLNSNILITGITNSISITGKQTYINGNITTYIYNIAIYLDILQINSGNTTIFNGDINGRFILICNNTKIISNSDFSYGISSLSKFTNCFISCLYFSTITGDYLNCNINTNFIYFRMDSNVSPNIINSIINVIGNPNIFFIGVFSGGSVIKIKNTIFNGSCGLLFRNDTNGRFISVDLSYCDLSNLTITNGVCFFSDISSGVGLLKIIYCILKTGTNIYSTGSLPLSPEVISVIYI